jgi:hypothetical protein
MSPMKKVRARRWEVVGAFLFNVIAVVVVAVIITHNSSKTNHAVAELQHQKASISQLERSNCKTKVFLVSSAHLRYRLYKADTTPKKKAADKAAVVTSIRLANGFSNEACPNVLTIQDLAAPTG